MIKNKDLVQRLNLLRSSPSFVLHEINAMGEAEVLKIDKIPKSNGIYWIFGTTYLKCGEQLTSVFRVDTDSGGSLFSVYWWIKGKWYKHEDSDVLNVLGLPKEQVFPFNWEYVITLEEDIYHQ